VSARAVIKSYYRLTKPGIIYGNGLTALAGFLFASRGHIVLSSLAAILAGTSLVIAGACVFNNYLDRGIDAKMKRTQRRALVIGKISTTAALSYAIVLTLGGFAILINGTNWLTVGVGVVAFVDYVVLYGIAKRTSVHSTLVGTVAGAASIVAGYTAAVNQLDAGAWLLCLVMVFWQMAHFYAIGIYRLDDYRAAGLPILSVKYGEEVAKQQIRVYMLLLFLSIAALYLAGYLRLPSEIVLLATAAGWLRLGSTSAIGEANRLWARRVFFYSLFFLLVFSIVLSVDHWI
jgi:protoheme IX farnesyltransferase